MAITITTNLADSVAAYAPCPLEGTTDRWPFTGTTRKIASIDAMASNGGNLQIEVISNSGWYVDDIVEISGATGDFEQYNGRHEVLSLETTDYITLNTTWVAATTGSTGEVSRQNNNLQIMAEVESQTSGDVVAILYAQVINGAFSFDFAKAFQTQLSSAFTLTSGELTTTSLSEEFDIYLTEVYQGVNYATYEGSETSTTGKIAHRMTEYSDDYLTGTSLLNGDMFADERIILHFMTDKTSSVRVKVTTDAGYNWYFSITTFTRRHCGYVIAWPNKSDVVGTPADWVKVTVQHDDGGGYADIKDTILVNKIRSCDTILYFENRLGGYVGYKFHDWTDVQDTEKIDKYTAETWKERELQGVAYSNYVFQEIRDIITSPHVYDEDGTEVRVLTDSLVYKSREVNPIIRIRYDETFINS